VLPADYRSSTALHDGTARYLFHNSELLSLETVVELWQLFAELTREMHFVAPSFQAWVEMFADDLDAGRYELRLSNGYLMDVEKRA
jgi:cell wall assembly regulator SMI1